MDRPHGDWAPLPGRAPEQVAGPGTRLSCDGETFELRPDGAGGTHDAWLSGPNPGYGFTASPTVDDVDQHRTNIRSFLSMIDPGTGYIEDV